MRSNIHYRYNFFKKSQLNNKKTIEHKKKDWDRHFFPKKDINAQSAQKVPQIIN